MPDHTSIPIHGHRGMRFASLVGFLFAVAHLVTVIVTCTLEGFGWGFNAWILDISGFLAGLYFAIQCHISATTHPGQFRRGNRWIAVWASATVAFRVFDTLMLLGVVRWDSIYIKPVGPVLWSNLISEVVLGTTFAIAALVASLRLLFTVRRSAR